MEPETCLDRLAQRLRNWRGERALTLQQLADRSGVAASTIHKIEVRKTIPTVAVLCRIAHGLDRPVTDFLDEDPAPAARLQRCNEALTELDPGVRVLGLGDAEHGRHGYRVALAAGGEPTALRVHGELLVVCEDGAVEITRGEARHRLGPGDLLALRSRAPARFWLRCGEDSRLLVLGEVPETPRALLDRGAHAAHWRAPAEDEPPWQPARAQGPGPARA